MPYFPDNTPIITDFDPLPSNTEILENWKFSIPPSSEDVVYFFPGTSQVIPPRTQTIDVPNYNELLGNSIYSEYRIIAFQTSAINDSFIVVSNGLTIDGSTIDENNLQFTEDISYVNLENGPYQEDDKFSLVRFYQVQGKRISDNFWMQVDSAQVRYSVQKVVSGEFYLSPNKINFNHALGDTSRPVVPFTVYTSSPILISLKEDFELVGDNVPTPFTWTGRTAYPVNSQRELQVRLKESADSRVDELRVDEIVLEAYPSTDYLFGRKDIRADILVSSSAEFTFQPQMLNFLMIVGAENNISKTLQIYGTGNWSITAPSWLSLSSFSGSNSSDISVEPIDEEYFSPGVYQNDIILSVNGKTYKIPVRLKVAERFEVGLSKSGLNFTDENTVLSKVYNNSSQERFVLVDVEVPQIGYPYATEQSSVFQYRLGFFKNETSIHIGQIVKRSLKHIDANQVFDLLEDYIQTGDLQTNLLEYYKPSSVRLNFQLFNASNNQLVENQEFKLIRFITGRNPFFEENLALLRDSDVEQKVTKQSIRLINFVTRQNIVLEVFRNGVLYDSYQENISIERLYGLIVDFKDFEIGDEIEYRLHPNEIIPGTKRREQLQSFIIYPEGKQFNQVVYEDEYRVPQFFDFCGDWRFSTENELIQSKDVINLVEAIHNEKSIKEHSLVMNTGYIPATNQVFLEQLKTSRNCWLLGNNSEPLVELVPKAYNMVNYDSEMDLYQYEAEFQINPTNDLQNYS